MSRKKYSFKTEAELCQAFAQVVPEPWVVYPETCGFDMVLVNPETEVHIGVEAKRTGNFRVLVQALPSRLAHPVNTTGISGPQYRAVLVDKYTMDFQHVANRLGLLVFSPPVYEEGMLRARSWGLEQAPVGNVSNHLHERGWFQWNSSSTLELPPIVPEMSPGEPHPKVLSKWRVASLRLLRRLRTRGYLTQADFEELGVRWRNWTDNGWVVKSGRGKNSTYRPSTALLGISPQPDKGYEKEYEKLAHAFPEDTLGEE